MELEISQHDGFKVVSQAFGGCAIIIRGNDVGPIFRNRTDAIDWGHDTACGDAIPPDYDITPLQGAVAGLVLLSLAFEYKGAQA